MGEKVRGNFKVEWGKGGNFERGERKYQITLVETLSVSV